MPPPRSSWPRSGTSCARPLRASRPPVVVTRARTREAPVQPRPTIARRRITPPRLRPRPSPRGRQLPWPLTPVHQFPRPPPRPRRPHRRAAPGVLSLPLVRRAPLASARSAADAPSSAHEVLTRVVVRKAGARAPTHRPPSQQPRRLDCPVRRPRRHRLRRHQHPAQLGRRRADPQPVDHSGEVQPEVDRWERAGVGDHPRQRNGASRAAASPSSSRVCSRGRT